MALSKINPQQTDIWKKLTAHFEETKGTHLRTYFLPMQIGQRSLHFNGTIFCSIIQRIE